MAAFFDLRASDYEHHMAEHIEDFGAFYDSAIGAIPGAPASPRILDLGIGTGLELDRLFVRFPDAHVTGIDVSRGMLDELAAKKRPWSDRLRTIQGSFLEADLGDSEYDSVLSVMALHHWVPEVKLDLYRRIRRALVRGGAFINADYIAPEEESAERLATFAAEGRDIRHDLHIDLPLTIETEHRLLCEAGFAETSIPFRRTHCATIVALATIDDRIQPPK